MENKFYLDKGICICCGKKLFKKDVIIAIKSEDDNFFNLYCEKCFDSEISGLDL